VAEGVRSTAARAGRGGCDGRRSGQRQPRLLLPLPGTSTSYSWGGGLGGDTATATVAGEEGARASREGERDRGGGCLLLLGPGCS
jgi:hypothetical protein